MALDTTETASADDGDAPVAELVFSCCICQATVSDVYATVESNQGFHSGSSGEDGIITRMYIGRCSHVVCSKHLEDGAIPFHPGDQHPRVACPRCKTERNDSSPKDLFAIQGLNPGQYDPTIPEMWMHCPAIKLDNSIVGMDAIRFQYMALCHYSRQVRKHWKAALQKQTTSEAALSKERKTRKKLQSEQAEMQKKIESLQNAEAQLKKWEDRKPVINHYMNAFTEMTKDNERMRGQLIELGVNVPVRKYLFESREDSNSSQRQSDVNLTEAQRDYADAIRVTKRQTSEDEHSSSARKRKRDELVNNGTAQSDRQASRDLMPPPLPRPVQRDIPRPSPSRQTIIPRAHQAPQPRSLEDGMQQPYQRIESRNEQCRDTTAYFGHSPSHPKEMMSRISPASSQKVSAAFRQRPLPQSDQIPFGYAPNPKQECGHHDLVSLAQLTLHSAGLSDQRMDYFIDDQRSFEYDYSGASYPPHEDSQSVAAQYNYDHHGSLPVRPSRSNESPHIIGSFQKQDFAAARAPHEVAQKQSNYADSPFFKHNGSVSRPDTMQRPPPGGYNSQQQSRTFADNYHVPPASTLGSRALHAVPGSSTGYGSQAYESAYVSPHRIQRPEAHRQQHTAIPQTPRNSQGFFRRPDRPPPPPVFRSPPEPEPRNRGGRITLPPSSAGPAPFMMDQDSVVSQIRGVRGVSSYRNAPTYQPSAPNYGSAVPLFSGGGRHRFRR